LIDGALEDKNVRKKYLNRANKAVDRLIYIVNDLDLITKLEAGELNVKWEVFDIIELIKANFELLEMKAAKKKIAFAFDMDYKVFQNGIFQDSSNGFTAWIKVVIEKKEVQVWDLQL